MIFLWPPREHTFVLFVVYFGFNKCQVPKKIRHLPFIASASLGRDSSRPIPETSQNNIESAVLGCGIDGTCIDVKIKIGTPPKLECLYY